MEGKFNVDTKFNIIEIKDYNTYLGFRGYYRKANNAAKNFDKLLIEDDDKNTFRSLVNYQGGAKDIYNNTIKDQPFQSLRNINTILCLFFSEHSGKVFKIDDVKDFLKNLKVQDDDKNIDSISSFSYFIELIRPHLSEEFKKYEYSISPKTWEFKIKKIKKNNTKGKSISKIYIIILSIIGTLLLIYSGFRYLKKNSQGTYLKSKPLIEYKCIFTPNINKNQILILPFKDINGEKDNEDIGFTIHKRFDSLNKADNLNIELKYCKEIVPNKEDELYFDELRKSYNSNHIIYGFYSDRLRSNTKNDKTILNYITDYSDIGSFISPKFTSNSIGLFKETSLEELNKGALQENLDFLIYYNAMLTAFDANKPYLVIKYCNILLNLKSDKKGTIHLFKSLAFQKLLKYELFLDEIYKSLNYSDGNKYISHINLGNFYAMFEKYDLAKFHTQIAYLIKPSIEVFNLLYAINDQLNLFDENIKLSNEALSIFPEKRYQILNYRFDTQKKIGIKTHIQSDSLEIAKTLRQNPNAKDDYIASHVLPFILKTEAEQRSLMLSDIRDPWSVNNDLKPNDSIQKDFCRIKLLFPEILEINYPKDKRVSGNYLYARKHHNVNLNECKITWKYSFKKK